MIMMNRAVKGGPRNATGTATVTQLAAAPAALDPFARQVATTRNSTLITRAILHD
jgi:hypothetical protein